VEAALVHQGACREVVLKFLRSFGYSFWIFGLSGYPERAPRVELDGVNIIAAHTDDANVIDNIRDQHTKVAQ
jgi:hypothetical protein